MSVPSQNVKRTIACCSMGLLIRDGRWHPLNSSLGMVFHFEQAFMVEVFAGAAVLVQ